ncbi:MAG: hypothetical protein M1823_003982 [Watsoniomyces obsoletus]|nr:MAG: hypothetical protein M1823_003982 [Watsoniomyces obsoletus]
MASLSNLSYTDDEKKTMDHWISVTKSRGSSVDQAATNQTLQDLNKHLSTRTTILDSKPSPTDIALYQWLRPSLEKWTPEQRTGANGYHHIVRFFDFVQSSPLFGLDVKKVEIDVSNVISAPQAVEPAKKDRKEKADLKSGPKAEMAEQKAAGQGNVVNQAPLAHRPKKEKQPKPAKESTAPVPSLIDLRVGHILKAVHHPNADSLYVSTIACGDPEGTDNTSTHEGHVVRTVCSGLNGLIPLEEMQDRKVVVVCNLKPVTMRGVKSAAMVLAASSGDQVELVNPPADATPGERVWFEGWEGEPEGVLNPKKKVWETIQPGFTTTEDLKVVFNPAAAQIPSDSGMAPLRLKSGGYCTVGSLKQAVVR